LDDDDVDRIAQRVVAKLVLYGALIVAGIWLLPLLAIGIATFLNSTLRDGSGWLVLPTTSTLVALPVLFGVWLWSRSRRQR
jgi:uncharacterized membrane protein